MSSRMKKKNRMSWLERVDPDVLEATSENFRIEVDKAFQAFLSDDSNKEYSFPPNLNNFERKHIHQKAAMHNLVSRSHGKDPNRVLTIYKKGHKSNFESFYIDISAESARELERVMQSYTIDNPYKNTVRLNCCDKVFGKLSLGPPPEVSEARPTPHIRNFQQQLPIYEMRNTIVSKVRSNDVLILSSETGSGKTTQIPQYIMDDARQRGERCRILCTQPRRISAVSVAERVAQERGASVGETVGYHIRLESKLGTNCNLIYCTNGVLIRSLMSGDRVLSSLTHIIIDEVHERDKLSDFLLICLKESLRKGVKIKLVLMSATINVDKFQSYFDGAEMLSIPGRLFNIKQLFLDDVLELTGYDAVVLETKSLFSENSVFLTEEQNSQYDDVIMQCMHCLGLEREQAWAQLLHYLLSDGMPVNYQHSENGLTALMAAVYQDNIDIVEKLVTFGADPCVQAKSGATAISIAEDKNLEETLLVLGMASRPVVPREELLTHYYKTCTDDDINYDLLIKLICTIHTQYNNGAILVFLPGYDDIMICNDRLLETDLDKNTYRVFYLHSSMNIREQHEVFTHLGSVRKIILSTNIAETSLTIDDVVYVIDCGKAKIQTYDSCSGLSSLQTQWISKACVKQRAGRAGRTQSGICFHLFSRTRYSSFLEEKIPEILRVPLEELCLNTKTLAGNLTSIYDFLVKAPDPPTSHTVKTAIENLECLGALDKDENLTPLGEYLSQLTIEPHLGKMLIYSVIFKCLDPILTIVASLAQKDPFQLPAQANLRTYAADKRKSLMANTYSDHMVYLKAFIKWQDSVKYRRERLFCRDFFISPSTMETILKTRSQLLGQLRAAKFVPTNGTSIMALNAHSENWPLVKAVISSGLYPKLAFKKSGHYCTRTEKRVLINNASPLSKVCLSLWLVYDEMVKVRNGHQVRGVTPITPITISLMCGIKVNYPMENYLEIDEWLEFEFPSPHIIYLRKYIETIIKKKLLSPTNALNETDEAALNALAKVLILEDRSANLAIPVGIKQKPKFFELNRPLDSSSDQGDYRAVANAYNTARFARNYPPQSNDQFSLSDTASYYSTNGYQSYDNGNSMLFANSYPGLNVGSRGYQVSPSLSFLNLMDNPSTSGAQALPQPSFPGFENSVFLLIRVKEESSVNIAYSSNKWVFSPQTEKHVMALEKSGKTVFLLYTVPKMNNFYGIARYFCFDESRHRMSAVIEWVFKTVIPYKKVRDPFQLPAQANLRTFAADKRKSLMANTYSDHMVYLKAFIEWQDSVKYRRERLFCRDFFISPSTIETILKTRSQLLGQLRAAKFVPTNGTSIMALNAHSENWPLVKAVISSGLYPKLAFKKSGHYCTRTEKRVLINNASPLSKVCLSLWLVYDEMVKVRNGHQVRGVTPNTPITISLMCGIKVNYPMENYLEIDEWLEFEFPSPHIIYLRKYIETIIKKKLLSPTNALNETDEAALNALAKVLILEDRSANLAIPVGIKQKPKFFELNRPLDSSSDQGDYRAVANAYNTARFARNYPPPSNDQFSLSDTASYYSTNGYQSYDNGNSMLFANSYPGLNVGSRGYQVSPSLSFLNLMDNPSTSGAQALPQPSFPGFENSVFLLIRVKEESSVNIAYSSNKWVFSPQTEKHVMALEKSGKTVFLLYTVPKMNNFYGIARYFCFDESRHRMSAVIEWVFKTVIPYKKVSHLRNSLNHNRLIYDGLDGQVIEMGVAMQLWGMFADSRKSMHGP